MHEIDDLRMDENSDEDFYWGSQVPHPRSLFSGCANNCIHVLQYACIGNTYIVKEHTKHRSTQQRRRNAAKTLPLSIKIFWVCAHCTKQRKGETSTVQTERRERRTSMANKTGKKIPRLEFFAKNTPSTFASNQNSRDVSTRRQKPSEI